MSLLDEPYNFADDIETAMVNVLTSAEIEIPQPGAQVLDHIESMGITWYKGPETQPGRRETKGLLPRGYLWVDEWTMQSLGAANRGIEALVKVRMRFYASKASSLDESMREARGFAASVSSLFDQLALRTYDDVPIDPTPLLDDWRAFANGMPATVTGHEVDTQDDGSAGLVGRAQLTIEFTHEATL